MKRMRVLKSLAVSAILTSFFVSCAVVAPLDDYSEADSINEVVSVADRAGTSGTPQNGTMMQYFHWYSEGGGVLWNEVKNKSTYLSDMGITALWLPPAYKGSGGYDVGYGVYDMYDLGEFNQKGTVATKYGTKDQYLAAINAAHNAGLQIYADVVFNHRGGADNTEWVNAVRVAKDNRNYEYGGDVNIEAWTNFTFPGRNNKYSDFKWHWYHFDGVDWAQNLGESAIFKFRGDGKGWDWEVNNENGNYDYLMYADLDMDHPEVVNELKTWAKWYVNFANLDGFRMDAVKHIKYGFFNDWISDVRRNTGKELFTVGEYWNYDVNALTHFLDSTNYCMSLFDAPMHMNFYQASNGNGYYDMGSILNGTLTKVNPMKSVSIVENHDTQPCQALESSVATWFKPIAYAIILLRQEGYPCVFYADLYGASYNDAGRSITMAPVKNLDKLIKARKLYAYGTQHDYFDDQNIVGWTREGVSDRKDSGCAVLVTDNAGGSKWMYVGTKFAGKQFYDYTGTQKDKVTINSDGWGQFWVDGGSVSVYVPVAETTTTTPSTSVTTVIDNGFETADGFTAKTTGVWTLKAEDGEWVSESAAISTGSKISGSYGCGLAAKGRSLQTPKIKNPQVLTFKAKASGTTSNYTAQVQYSNDGTNWTTAKSFAANGSNTGTIKTTAATNTVTLNLTGSYYLRFYISARSAGSFYFDDVKVTGTGLDTSSSGSTGSSSGSTTTVKELLNNGFETANGFTTKSSGTWTVAAKDGTWSAYAYINSTAKIDGSYGCGLAAKGRYITTPQVTAPKTVSFKAKASGSTANFTVDVQTSTDGSTWTTVKSYKANGSNTGDITTTAKTITATVNKTGKNYVRFYISARSAGSLYMDSVVIKG